MNKKLFPLLTAMLLVTGCGSKTTEDSGDPADMQYIKSSVLYDTLMNMYSDPDSYLGKYYHMVGRLYPSTDDGETFYSVYAEGTSGHGIGLELDWDDFSGFTDNETITVEGKLERETGTHDGETIHYLVLRVSKIEKRDQS